MPGGFGAGRRPMTVHTPGMPSFAPLICYEAIFPRALIDRQDRPPTATWIFQAGRFPVLIQTQENANRMRIVAFIGDAAALGREALSLARSGVSSRATGAEVES